MVSSTLEDLEWSNSTLLKGDVATQVSKLKLELDAEIVVPASYQLARTLIAHDLVDELRLVVFPVVLGDGERLFDGTSGKKPMRLVDTKTIGDGLVFVTYELVQHARRSPDSDDVRRARMPVRPRAGIRKRRRRGRAMREEEPRAVPGRSTRPLHV